MYTRPMVGSVKEKVLGEHENIGEKTWGDFEHEESFVYPSTRYWKRLSEDRLIAQKWIKEATERAEDQMRKHLADLVMRDKEGVCITVDSDEIISRTEWRTFQGIVGMTIQRFYKNDWQPRDPDEVLKSAKSVCADIQEAELKYTF